MPRKCKNVVDKRRKRSYRAYDENVLMKAIALIKAKKISINLASTKYAIPKGTLVNKIHDKHSKSVGSPLVLTNNEEKVIVEHVVTVSEWGFPFGKNDLRFLVKQYLDKCERKVLQFNDNLPTRQWAARFLKRHKHETSEMKCQNLKRSKAQLNAEDMNKYFDNLKTTLTQEDNSLIPPHRIFNFDETNLTDDLGARKFIFKGGTKYPERIMDHSKSSTSVMYCGSASGDILPPYVVYKSTHLYTSWMEGGPAHTRYNRSKSGWFDGEIFKDWFIQLFLPYVKKHKLTDEGKVVLMGDNLSSHFSLEVLKLCRDNKIAFICVPKNSTHIAQPLDVAFYRPLKGFWRDLLEKWKLKHRKMQTLTKEMFPGLLNNLHEKLVDENKKSKNLVAGFKKCGVYPFNPGEVISRLPEIKANIDKTEHVSQAVLDLLKELRSEGKTQKPRRKKIAVEAGKSVEFEDLEKLQEQERLNAELKKSEKKPLKKRTNVAVKTKNISSKNNSSDVGDAQNKNKSKKQPSKNKKKSEERDKDCYDNVADKKVKPKGRKREAEDEKTKSIKRVAKNLYIDNGSESSADVDGSGNEEQGVTCNETTRPSISEMRVGEFVIVEYLVPGNKKYFVGMVKNTSADILNVAFLIKERMDFSYPASNNISMILPTQVVKVLPTPETKRGKIIFPKDAVQGFYFERR